MNPQQWERVKQLLTAALELPPAERRAFVKDRCAKDTTLRNQVLPLLAETGDDRNFLEPPPAEKLTRPLRLLSFDFRGCRLGDFELVEVVGSGASGVVYRGRQVSVPRDAAIKILSPHLCNSAERRERFHREANAAQKLRHPGVVGVFASGEQDGALFIAMEYVHGRSVRACIDARRAQLGAAAPQRAPADADERAETESELRQARVDGAYVLPVDDPAVATAVVEKAARALQHCHEHGVTHRDIKPLNLLVDELGDPHLVDFGLAKDAELEELTDTGMLSGTPHYMSPEQARAIKRHIDHRTDIYSLGAVLYEMLALRRPFEIADPERILHAIKYEDPERVERLNPRVGPGLAAVCRKSMAKSAADRYATAREMADDLARCLSGERVVAHGSRWRAAWQKLARRWRADETRDARP